MKIVWKADATAAQIAEANKNRREQHTKKEKSTEKLKRP